MQGDFLRILLGTSPIDNLLLTLSKPNCINLSHDEWSGRSKMEATLSLFRVEPYVQDKGSYTGYYSSKAEPINFSQALREELGDYIKVNNKSSLWGKYSFCDVKNLGRTSEHM